MIDFSLLPNAYRIDRGARRALPLVVCMSIVFFSACVPAGVSDLSSRQGQVAVVGNNDLYVVSNTAREVIFYASRPDVRFQPVFTLDGSSVVYVDQSRRLVMQPLGGGSPTVLLTRIGQPGPGALAILPNGELFLLDTAFNGDRYIKILNLSTGETTQHIQGIDQVFVAAAALKPKPSNSAAAPYVAARIEAAEPGQLKVVLVPRSCLLADKTCFFLYSAEPEGFVFQGQLPRTLTAEMQLLLARRLPDDVTSGLLTADGQHAVLRVRVPFNVTTGLIALDLTSDAPPVTLIESAASRPDYSIAPSGHWMAYADRSGGVSQIQLYNLLTGERSSLGPGTLDPQWWK